ncbi:hypothetical protein CEXT_273651 [Caerostris extrusa]|uniref:Uncharacterized protein n=1 Tax=Caerostris extrusa TaxID=172846 RepID=A0AAV4RX74_CAEEX|nr:hypothetical protein CEXT_273651 [Caerostris extrusa]
MAQDQKNDEQEESGKNSKWWPVIHVGTRNCFAQLYDCCINSCGYHKENRRERTYSLPVQSQQCWSAFQLRD